jgi:uncharacterized membrane protein
MANRKKYLLYLKGGKLNFMKNKKVLFSTKWIAYTAMLTSLVIATSYIPPVPITPFGSIYWCDAVIFIAAYLLDPIASFIIGGVGTLLYDLIHANAAMMLPSLVIHGLQGAVVSALIHYVFPKKWESLWAGIASFIGALIVIGGYFVLRMAIQGKSIEYATYRIVANIAQEIIGIAVAMAVCYATTFKQQLAKSHLLPDFKREVIEDKPQAA